MELHHLVPLFMTQQNQAAKGRQKVWRTLQDMIAHVLQRTYTYAAQKTMHSHSEQEGLTPQWMDCNERGDLPGQRPKERGGGLEGCSKVFVLAFERRIYDRQASSTQQRSFEVSGYVHEDPSARSLISWRDFYTPAAHVVAVILEPCRGCSDSPGLSWSCLHGCLQCLMVCTWGYTCAWASHVCNVVCVCVCVRLRLFV